MYHTYHICRGLWQAVKKSRPENPIIKRFSSAITSSVPNSMQNLARNSRRYHAKFLGGAYRQPQSYHLKSAMGTQTNSEGHSPVITPATLKTTLTEKLEASYVDVEDISGKSCPLLAYGSICILSHFTFSLCFRG